MKIKNRIAFLMAFSMFLGFSAAAQSERDLKSMLVTRVLIQDLRLETPARLVRADLKQELFGDLVQVELDHAAAGRIRLLLQGPRGFWQSNQPQLKSLLLVSGFFTGQDSVRLLGEVPGTVLVGFQYPYDVDEFRRDPGLVLQFMRQTPGQVALALKWLSEQPWLESKGLMAAGVSLGGIIMPSALHMAQSLGVPVSRSIFVCTGAHLTPILESNLAPRLGPDLAKTIAWSVANVTSLHDPKLHLPYLRGSFLSIRTDADTVIPASSTQLLEDLLPTAVTSVVLPGGHINPDQTRVIHLTRRTILRWIDPLAD